MRFQSATATLLSACLFACPSVQAGADGGDTALRDSGDAAHLFGYRIHPGAQARFEDGYRRHLAWHRTHRDALVWYGWIVADGPRQGMFVDGTFGAPFAAFDRRVDLPGDGADAASNVTPHAEPAWRASYRLRREFGNGQALERWQPGASARVVHYRLRAGTQPRFERALAAARERLRGRPGASSQAWYETVSGGDLPGFMRIEQQGGWTAHDAPPADPEALLRDAPELGDLRASVESARAETWTYRPDLSLIPGAAP